MLKNPPTNIGDSGLGDPCVRKILWRKKWQPTPVFSPENPHGQRSLVGYTAWAHKRVRHDLAAKQQQRGSSAVEYLKLAILAFKRTIPLAAMWM